MTNKNNLQGAKTMFVLLAIASLFIVACKKSGTVAPSPASAAAAAAAAQTQLLTGKWTDGKEEQKVYDSTKKLVVDTVFNTGNNYHYDQYTSNGTYYYVDNEFALDTQATYKYKVANNAVTYTDLNDAAHTLANIVQLTSQNLELEYDFPTSGSSSVQVQMFHLDTTMTYTVNFTKYYTKAN